MHLFVIIEFVSMTAIIKKRIMSIMRSQNNNIIHTIFKFEVKNGNGCSC